MTGGKTAASLRDVMGMTSGIENLQLRVLIDLHYDAFAVERSIFAVHLIK